MRSKIALIVPFLACCSAVDDDTDAAQSQSGTETGTDLPDSTSGSDEPGNDTSAPSGTTTATTQTGDGDGDDEGVDDTSGGDDESDSGSDVRPGPDFRELGPHTVQSANDSFAIKQGCSMDYTHFTPEGVTPGGTVILAHGFQGNRGSMVGWAEHLASWGLEVFTPDLCHATPLDSDHAQNGADLITFREHLTLDEVVYAGYSAGGLAAFLATAQDVAAVAVLGLDMVDNSDLGAAAAADVDVPAHNVVAEPDMCNTSGNGVAVFNAAAQGRVIRVTEADHCDFQEPGDVLCFLCSSPNPTYDTATIKATIIGLSTAFALWQTELDATGDQWWFEGLPWFEDLASTGIINAL